MKPNKQLTTELLAKVNNFCRAEANKQVQITLTKGDVATLRRLVSLDLSRLELNQCVGLQLDTDQQELRKLYDKLTLQLKNL